MSLTAFAATGGKASLNLGGASKTVLEAQKAVLSPALLAEKKKR